MKARPVIRPVRAAAVLTIASGLLWPASAMAKTPRFELPLDCREGCYVQNFVDRDTSKKYQDYRCGVLTYDGHKGTDFRISGIEAMERGVAVRAAASGIVSVARDGLPDVHFKLLGRAVVTDQGLGNVVQIDHGGGWQTIYAHMRRGSVLVKKGQRIKIGQPIGLIGLSGLTEFPHVHFGVKLRGHVVDPYIGPTKTKSCKIRGVPMWNRAALAKLQYRRSFVIAAGFANKKLTREAMLYGFGATKRLPTNSRNLLYHIDFAGIYAGDGYQIRIIGPDGKAIFDKSGVFKKSTAVRLIIGGKSKRKIPWKSGIYRGEFRLFREQGKQRQNLLKVDRQIEIR